MRGLTLAAVLTAALACSGWTEPPSAAPSPSSKASPAAGGCGRTEARVGAIPAWLDAAAGHDVPRLPYVIAVPDSAAGFLFARPLRAGHPDSPMNKVLWVVRTPREGSSLQLDARPLGTDGPVVHQSQPADSSPGEIYPSIVDVPTPGCWRFTLQWATGRAEVDVLYV